MRVLVTGHTGFKGSWLVALLSKVGFEVSGLALDPNRGALFDRAALSGLCEHDLRADIRSTQEISKLICNIAPDAVIHLAAQPLVRESYASPRLTMETNVMGTLSVLEGISACDSVQAAVMVTTDKVYMNVGRSEGYVESDALGGRDPYSASKSMADILISSWSASFSGCPIAIARAGNVIGGGDISPNRLLPDLIRGFESGLPVEIRSPAAVRPWQHVVDCLNGYVLLMEALLRGEGEGAWNFGPEPSAFRTVREVADLAAKEWGPGAYWREDGGEHPHEERLLTLDSTKARTELAWRDELTFEESIEWTIDWSKRVSSGEAPIDVTMNQIQVFEERRSGTI